MKVLRRQLEKLKSIERRKYHQLIHKIHKKHRISGRTLLYVKEYGPHTNISGTIIKESLKILLFASLISSLGGLALENMKQIFFSIIPLVILLPVLNDMVGDYGIIVSSRFTTLLHTGKVKGKWYKNNDLKKLFAQIFIISVITALISSFLALFLSAFYNYGLNIGIIFKIFLIAVMDVSILVSILSLISVFAGLYLYRHGEDPNNFLIPITTSIADFGNILVLAFLVLLFF